MVFLLARRLRDKFWPEPLPPPGSFEGQTVLVTGATAGLGLAAAVHFARLNARVIITSRTASQGEAAVESIAQQAGISKQGQLYFVELDMSRYSSCVSFVERLKQHAACERGLDVAVLNAGLINVDFVRSPEGWEQTIQVNTLSTTLLGLLLLDCIKEKQQQQQQQQRSSAAIATKPHLVFVTSRDHLDPDITRWTEWSAQGGILRHFSDEQNWPSDQLDPNYANSKLLLTYAVERIRERAKRPGGTVDAIVNTVCPGLVSTDLGRSIAKISKLMQLVVPIHTGLLGKSADYGARFYVTAARTLENEHGKYIQSLFTDEEYRSMAIPNLESETAKKVKDLVWSEISAELRDSVPGLEDMDGQMT